MEIQQILTADILDIIFEGRNKDYGAYDLRKTYNKRIVTSFVCSTALLCVLYTCYVIAGVSDHKKIIQFAGPDIVLDEVDPKKKEKEIIPLPKVQKPEPQQLKVIQSTKPVIVKEAAPEEMPPLQDEIEISKIGLANIDGGHDDDITAPPIQDKGRDILSKPQHKEDEKDKIFISVQIESQYKGGSSAWLYYLNKNLASNYPAKAVDDGIQGRVVIQFIVDQEGNVSDVKAISGPVELREAAIKVIRESGTWIPAIQNGRKVKSYKQQPITFQITE